MCVCVCVCVLQAAVLASQEKLRYVAAFGDKKEYIALIELQLNQARYNLLFVCTCTTCVVSTCTCIYMHTYSPSCVCVHMHKFDN